MATLTGTLSAASFNPRDGVLFTPQKMFQGVEPPAFNSDWLPDPTKMIQAYQEQYLPFSMLSYINNPALHRQVDVQIAGVMKERLQWINKELLPVMSTNDVKWNVRTLRMLNTQLHETPNLAHSTVMQQQILNEEVVAVRYGKSIPYENDEYSTVEGRRNLQDKLAAIIAATVQKMAYIAYKAVLAADQSTPNDVLREANSLRDFVNAYHRYKLEYAYSYKGPINLNTLASRYADILRETNDDVEADLVIVPPTYGPFLKYRSPLQYRFGDGGTDASNTLKTDESGSISKYRVRVAPGIYDENERRTFASISTLKTRIGSFSDFAVDVNRKKFDPRGIDPGIVSILALKHVKSYVVGEIYDTRQDKHVTITVGDCMEALNYLFIEDPDEGTYLIHANNAAAQELLDELMGVPDFTACLLEDTGRYWLNMEIFLDTVDFIGLFPCETQVMDSLHLVVSKGGIGYTFLGQSRYETGVKADTQESIVTFTKWMAAHVFDRHKVIRIPNQLFAGYVCGKDSRIIDPQNYLSLKASNYDDDEIGGAGSVFMTFALRSQFKIPEFIFSSNLDFFGGERSQYSNNFLPYMHIWMRILQFPSANSLEGHLTGVNLALILYHNGMKNFYRGIMGNSCASQTHVQFETTGTREVRNYGLTLLPGCNNPA